MKRLFFFLIFCVLGLSANAQSQPHPFVTSQDIKVGAERWEVYKDKLSGKRVALVANHTTMLNSEQHLVDFLIDKEVDLKLVFAPEHGFRGKADAGENIEDGKDAKTGLPIVSLYGSHKKPTAADLKDIDLVIFDIQDVGARFYTYISTMTYVMEACAENGKQFMVLDRPNPHGFYIDGPMLEKEHESFVGLLPIPIVHGMTVGELAKMIKGEAWIEKAESLDLTVITCEGYNHNDIYVLPIGPSPNLPNMNSILLYPSLCLFEGTTYSVGRGTDHPFEIFGHPNAAVGSFVFVPESTEGASNPLHKGVPCVGWDLTEIGGNRIRQHEGIVLDWLQDAYESFPDKSKFFRKDGFFTLLAGTETLRKQLESGMDAEEIRKSWQADLLTFSRKRKAYLLYHDFD